MAGVEVNGKGMVAAGSDGCQSVMVVFEIRRKVKILISLSVAAGRTQLQSLKDRWYKMVDDAKTFAIAVRYFLRRQDPEFDSLPR